MLSATCTLHKTPFNRNLFLDITVFPVTFLRHSVFARGILHALPLYALDFT